VAVLLASETRKLLVGESARPEVVAKLRELIEHDPDVSTADALLTMQLGRDSILLNAGVRMTPGLTGEQQAVALERIAARIRSDQPQVQSIALQPRPAGSRRAPDP
jgi:divalent metal cation (Fe/Co/Zn/Cd) transporter